MTTAIVLIIMSAIGLTLSIKFASWSEEDTPSQKRFKSALGIVIIIACLLVASVLL